MAMNHPAETERLAVPALEHPPLRSLSEVQAERVDWKRRDNLYAAMALIRQSEIDFLCDFPAVAFECSFLSPPIQEPLAVADRVLARLREQINEITDVLDTSGPTYHVYSRIERIER